MSRGANVEIVVVVFIIMLGVSTSTTNLALASSSDEEEESTTEFETYTNPDYGFSIDFPSDWDEQESNLQEYEVVHFLSPEAVPGAINIFMIEVLPGMSLYDMAVLDNNSDNIRTINITNILLK